MTESKPVRTHDIQSDDTLVFVHIPKTAGITLRTYLDSMWHPASRCPLYFSRQLDGIVPNTLSAYRSFIAHFHLSEMEWLLPAPFVAVTVLREPTGRYVSDFLHLKHKPLLQYTPAIGLELSLLRSMSLDEFVTRDDLLVTKRLPNLQTHILGAPLDPETLGTREEPFHGQVLLAETNLKAAKQKLQAMMCFGLTERLQESLFLFCYVFGWRPLRDTQALNRKAESAHVEKPTPAALERIIALNQSDLALYEFATELFEQRVRAMTDALLQDYGTRADMHLKYPLATDKMVELLERHYTARYTRRHAPLSPPLLPKRFTFNETLDGVVGWQGRELSARDGVFSWSGPQRSASLDLPCADHHDVVVRFRVIYALRPEVLNTLELTANGERVKLQRTQDEVGAHIYRGVAPRRALQRAPYLRLTWTVAEALAPSAVVLDSTDARKLGIAVHWVELGSK